MTDHRPSIDEETTDYYNFAFKVMLLGDSCTGKTCLLIRFKDGTFLNNNFISTVGIDYRNKVIEIDNVKIKLQIWDTAGQERFRSVTHAYYRDADALLLLFDVTNRISFENIRSWLAEVKEYANDNVMITLVGNKVDLSSMRKVKTEEARKLAHDYGIQYMETSAKSGQNVNEAFLTLTTKLTRSKMDNGVVEDKVDIGDATLARRPNNYWCCKSV